MLKYHNFDKENETLELFYNNKKLHLDDKLGRELISSMRKTYFHLWDLVSMTHFDDIKKRLLKNKLKAITVDIFGKLINKYANDKSAEVFTSSLSIDGLIIREMDSFAKYVFNDETNGSYFFKESIRVFSDSILSLSIMTP